MKVVAYPQLSEGVASGSDMALSDSEEEYTDIDDEEDQDSALNSRPLLDTGM